MSWLRQLLTTHHQIAKDKPQADLQISKHELYTRVNKPLPENIQNWLTHVDEKKALDFKMTEYCGDHSKHQPPKWECDFDKVNTSAIISNVEVFVKNEKFIEGYRLTVRNGVKISRGITTSPDVKSCNVDDNDKITAVTLHADHVGFEAKTIYGIGIATARAVGHYLGAAHGQKKEREDLLSSAPHPNWSFKGFWYEEGDAFDRMGVFYGLDSQDPVKDVVVM